MSILKKPFICIIDDDCDHAEVLGEVLIQEGFLARSFPSASQFLEEIQNFDEIDLIISDINMPGHSGYDLCRDIRKDSSSGRLPIILISGGSPWDKAKGLEAGADDFIHKPCPLNELLAKVNSLIEIRHREIQTVLQLKNEVQRAERLDQLRRFLSPNIASMLAESGQVSTLTPHETDVSVLFADLRRFTSFAETHPAVEVMEVLSSYYTIVGNAAIKFGGTLGHLAGDGIMVFFNDPEPVANHQEKAACMALEARADLLLEKEKWKTNKYNIDFGMGLTSGIATLGEIGFERFSQYSVIGRVTNLASRLCTHAIDGQILACEGFLRHLSPDVFEIEPLGEVEMKGIIKPIPTYNIVSLINSSPAVYSI